MSFIKKLYDERRKLAEVLSEYLGIRKLVEQLYPDRAHFLYELLQNAEDAGATEAHFELQTDALTFEHNGRPFSEEDVRRITDIGQSTKEHDQDKIGRFGVGFKAVFAYCETPHIWCPTFSFKISNLVQPTELVPPTRELGNRTRFRFPFNNPKKSPAAAHAEIQTGLSELTEETLLFLPHLELIRWNSGEDSLSEIRRVYHSNQHVEIVRLTSGLRSSAHFLRFARPVDGLANQNTAVAFDLELLDAATEFDPQKPLAKQLKIVPAEPGRVAVFFPAEKETSGLRFHVHAPFVPEVSRASIKESPLNEPMFEQLAQLAAAALVEIRDLGLLTIDFLAVLPNQQDEQIPVRYQCIRGAVVDAMNDTALTPTHTRSHAPARQLLQAKSSLKDLLSQEDLKFLSPEDIDDPKWCISATQKNSNVDRMLSSLAVQEWDFDDFLQSLLSGTTEGGGYRQGRWTNGPNPEFLQWLGDHSHEWHQRLYALLFAELSSTGAWYQLDDAQIVRLSTGNYSNGKKCFFPTEETRDDEHLPRVDGKVYSSGRSRPQQSNSRKLLESIGVREVGEMEHVEAVLQQRYTADNFRPQKQDFKRFVALVEKDSTAAALFADFSILECEDGKWRKPRGVFLDAPFLDTGLSHYYAAVPDQQARHALADTYANYGIPIKRIVKFAADVGVQLQLRPTVTQCRWNPEFDYLRAVGGERYTSPIDKDFTIPGLTALLARPTLEIAQFLWRTMQSLPPTGEYLIATYQRSAAGGSRKAHSQLVHQLRKAQWVPQGTGTFVKPENALSTLLPAGMAFDPGARWLQAIEFGKVTSRRSEVQRQREVVARELGFRDHASLERAQRFASLAPEEQERILTEREAPDAINLPENEPTNPERRAARVSLRAAAAPERHSVSKSRSVPVGLDDVKEEARQYLRQQYTNLDGEMICQICKDRLPFRLPDGTDYFEAVELLPNLTKRHHQNYLALCPNHGAMFQYANANLGSLAVEFKCLVSNELPLILAQKSTSIYFTKTHLADLNEVLRVDAGQDDCQ